MLQEAIKSNIKKVHDNIISYSRKHNSLVPKILAISKGRSIEEIQYAFEAGIEMFGENYLQEALKKIKYLPEIKSWHFTGKIQSNKLKKIAENFHWVHTLSDINHAKKLNKYAKEYKRIVNVCIQINIDADENKSGILSLSSGISSLEFFVQIILKYLTQLNIRGLMCILEKSGDYERQYTSFYALKKLKDRLEKNLNIKLDTLSMGMSKDVEAAIATKSTIVRIGESIFGR
jgi:pyridoxal phosphate enzyme (YggS family)